MYRHRPLPMMRGNEQPDPGVRLKNRGQPNSSWSMGQYVRLLPVHCGQRSPVYLMLTVRSLTGTLVGPKKGPAIRYLSAHGATSARALPGRDRAQVQLWAGR